MPKRDKPPEKIVRYQKGDVVLAQHDWEDFSTEYVVHDDDGMDIKTYDGQILERCSVKSIVKHMTESEYFRYRQDKMLAKLPEEFRGVISNQAYEDGHAYGYEEVLNLLDTLVDCLVGPIEKYTKRILTPSE